MFIPLLAGLGLGLPSVAIAGQDDLETDALPDAWGSMLDDVASDGSDYTLEGDFDGDGKTDVARVRGFAGETRVDVFRSQGDHFEVENWGEVGLGGFWAGQKYLVADCNGDGRDDIVRVFDDGGLASVDVLHSTAGASEYEGFVYSRYATGISVWKTTDVYLGGDFNADGKDDVARVWLGGNQLSNINVFEAGDQSFANESWATDLEYIYGENRWNAGDYDGDGKDDISRTTATLNGGYDVDMLWSDGAAFGYASYASNVGIEKNDAIGSGDFDADGLDDLAILDPDDPYVLVLLNDGETMASRQLFSSDSLSSGEELELVGDYDGDGKAEVAVAYEEEGSFELVVFTPDGSPYDGEPELGKLAMRWASSQGSFWDAQLYFAGDFNGDGSPDVARVYDDGGATTVDVHVNTGDGLVMERWATKLGGHWGGMDFVVGDFDGDGTTDLVKAWDNSGLTSLDVYLSNGTSLPSFGTWADRQGGHWAAQKFVAGDYNGDGRDDVAKVWNYGDQVWVDVYLSTGSGFEPFTTWISNAGGGFSEDDDFLAGDFDGDGDDDIARVFQESVIYSLPDWLSGGDGFTGLDFEVEVSDVSIDVYRSSGAGFGAERWMTAQKGFEGELNTAVGDFDVNGRDDIMVYGPTEDARAGMILYRSGTGVYDWFEMLSYHRDSQIGYSPRTKVAAGDFDSDGYAELVTIAPSKGDGRTNFDVWGGQTDPDPTLVGVPGDPTRYTPEEVIANLASEGLTLVADTTLEVNECTIVYPHADADGYDVRDLGMMTCVRQDGDDVKVDFNPVYGGCAFDGDDLACNIGVNATQVDIPVLGQTINIVGPSIYTCGSISREMVCAGVRKGIWESSFMITSSGDINIKIGINVGPFSVAGAEFSNGVLSGYIDIPGVFEVHLEIDVVTYAVEVADIGEAGFTYVVAFGELLELGELVDFLDQGLLDVAGSIPSLAEDGYGYVKDAWDAITSIF
ncbi:VCBS repeat-containing protein [Pseudenhygromyxa sp. WMMC2535]|uniref:FG-GAP repeat domain-containing protein n=1 Tax=Pseudenhygromyxa sp. WMMC2535 TaxID=2712867 RepID=UPI00155406B8|nr:VCBS repeat-containing protein [Pseudenhygromyxa sp. WMMC2535]